MKALLKNRHFATNCRKILRSKGMVGIFWALVRRVSPPKSRLFPLCKDIVIGRNGLEIGGPSWIFSRRGSLPLYPFPAGLDNCNFGRNTVWEGIVIEGSTFKYDKAKPPGRQYIGEAAHLDKIQTGSYDFVLSCHTIEHSANPLGAIKEWMRVLREDGKLVLVVPHMEGTFDHRRAVTDLAHLVEDLRVQRGEDDLTHLAEILRLHDEDRDLGTADFATFKERSERNLEFRCLHHHVFDTSLVVQMLNHVALQILAVEAILPFHIIAVAQKPSTGTLPANEAFLEASAAWLQSSPFKRDIIV